MELGFHLPIFDIDGGKVAIAGELAAVGPAAEESGATWLERKTLRLVAQYGDRCNLIAASPAQIEHKLDVLRRHCDDVGRD